MRCLSSLYAIAFGFVLFFADAQKIIYLPTYICTHMLYWPVCMSGLWFENWLLLLQIIKLKASPAAPKQPGRLAGGRDAAEPPTQSEREPPALVSLARIRTH